MKIELQDFCYCLVVSLEFQHRSQGINISGDIIETGGREEFDQLAYVQHTRVDLRFEKKDCLADNFSTALAKAIDQFGMQVARPGPTPEVVDTFIVNGDDGDLAGR